MVRGVSTLEARGSSGSEEDFRQSPEYAERLRQVFARHLRDQMRKRGWNQAEVARRAVAAMPKGSVEITRDNISRYCRGENFPGPERIDAIAKALGVKASALIPEEEFLTEDEFYRLKGAKRWDVNFTSSANGYHLKIDAVLPLDVVVKVMELLQPHAPKSATPDED
jgi:transcriptional regulator with XRE-family HTH domain